MSHPFTLTHWILSKQHNFPNATGDLSILLHAIEIASKYVSSKVRQAGLLNLFGLEGQTNIQGEEQKKLDVLANSVFIESLRRSQKVSIMCSEENEIEIVVEGSDGKYVAVFDPLDGSSNIDVNISIGTIFGIYKRTNSGKATKEEMMRPGKELVCAGYTMYGSASILMITFQNDTVNGFTLDTDSGEFVLTYKDVKVPAYYPIYSVNQGNSLYWDKATTEYVNTLIDGKEKKPSSLRYVGSMVADVHRTLIYGGIFMYPGDSKSPDGKLRLLYEANPMSMLCENAGGMATTGRERILDIQPNQLHQRVPVFLGSKDMVQSVIDCYKKHSN